MQLHAGTASFEIASTTGVDSSVTERPRDAIIESDRVLYPPRFIWGASQVVIGLRQCVADDRTVMRDPRLIRRETVERIETQHAAQTRASRRVGPVELIRSRTSPAS
jgi:hypothetical protein